MIFMSHYCRNLFAGLDTAPDVSATDVLLIADRDRPEATLAGIAWSWLEAVALDRSPRYRGIAVVSSTDAIGVPDAGIARYRPVTERFRCKTPDEDDGSNYQQGRTPTWQRVYCSHR